MKGAAGNRIFIIITHRVVVAIDSDGAGKTSTNYNEFSHRVVWSRNEKQNLWPPCHGGVFQILRVFFGSPARWRWKVMHRIMLTLAAVCAAGDPHRATRNRQHTAAAMAASVVNGLRPSQVLGCCLATLTWIVHPCACIVLNIFTQLPLPATGQRRHLRRRTRRRPRHWPERHQR